MDGFRTAKFPYDTLTGSMKQNMIYNKLSGISYTEDTCASLCYTHSPSTPICHFFILDGSACALGNFGFNGTQHSLTSATLTAYYNESRSKVWPFSEDIHWHCHKRFAEFIHSSNLSSAYSVTTALPATGWVITSILRLAWFDREGTQFNGQCDPCFEVCQRRQVA